MAHHKRRRAKNQRAGCCCNGKLYKHNGFKRLKWADLRRAGVTAPTRISNA